MYYLDYSAAHLSGTTVKNAGYGGVIRYIDDITQPALVGSKHITKDEYNSHLSVGNKVFLVIEVSTTDADGGFNRGVEYAKRAKVGADFIGYKDIIFFCNDRTTVTNSAAWIAYLQGAASVLGWNRIGAYGFYNAIDLAKNNTGAVAFWQAGRKSDADQRPFLNFWQDNNVQVTVGGISCDRNLVLKPMPSTLVTGGDNFLMALTDKQQLDLYNRIFGMLRQRWFVKNADDTITEVPEGTANAVPASILDTLDGNYLVGRTTDLDKRLTALEAAVGKVATPTVDVAALADAIAAKVNDGSGLKQAIVDAVLEANRQQWNK